MPRLGEGARSRREHYSKGPDPEEGPCLRLRRAVGTPLAQKRVAHKWIIPMVHEAKVNRQRTRSRHDRKSRGSRGNSVGLQRHPRGRLDAPFGVGGCGDCK
jgi:hypothetical protein